MRLTRVLVSLLLALAGFVAPLAAQPLATRGFTEPLPPIDGRRIALVIGNANYVATGWSRLPNAGNDAAHVTEQLIAAGFDVRPVTDADHGTLIRELDAFAGRAENADVALIYFSGHGFQHNYNQYIVPADGPDRITDTQVEERFVNINRVVRAGAARGLSLLFLDACRSRGPVLDIATAPAGGGVRAALFGPFDVSEAVVFYATAPSVVAYDSAPPGSSLSPFAAAIGMGIRMPGMDLGRMFGEVHRYVVQATQNLEPTQRPQIGGAWSRTFYFTPPVRLSAASVQAAPIPVRRLDIPLRTLSTIDDSTLISRVLAEYGPAQMLRMAEAGDPLALYLVGYMYEFGVQVERSLPQARMWLERAAATGHPAGQLEYGYFLLNHGQGEADRARGLALYREAAAQGYAKAMSHLAIAIWNSDRPEAMRLSRAAAALGDANAHYALATQGERASVVALERLAASGDVEGDRWLCELGEGENLFLLGRCRRAADAGRINAQARLALMLDAGRGGARDPAQARQWAYLALSRRELPDDLKRALEAMLARPAAG